jgi:glycosyltransferase involved in cell wall biosynthesis
LSVRITVVTPSFNQAKFLEETLRSVLSQRDQIHEYFVLDGGSTDGSVEIIQAHAARGGIDYWHSRPDRGQSDAIDQGFKRATGDYLAWINSDDLFLPGALKRIRDALEEHAAWDALTGYHVRIDSESRMSSMHRIPGESCRAAWWGIHHIAQQTCIFRKSMYEKVGGLDLAMHCAMDTELWLRMFAVGAKWGHIPEYLAAFRIHEAAKGSSWLDEYRRETALVHARHPQYTESVRQFIGLPCYRLMQLLSGRHLRAAWDLSRYRGKSVTDVFGDWNRSGDELLNASEG